MRVEIVNGRYLLCGHILKADQIKVGQVWAPASRGNRAVTILEYEDGWVTYEGEHQPKNTKDQFAFQCRYCLILPSAEIPEELR